MTNFTQTVTSFVPSFPSSAAFKNLRKYNTRRAEMATTCNSLNKRKTSFQIFLHSQWSKFPSLAPITKKTKVYNFRILPPVVGGVAQSVLVEIHQVIWPSVARQ